MRADFVNLSVFQHDQSVSILKCGKSVCNRKNGTPADESFQRFLNIRLRLRIHR